VIDIAPVWSPDGTRIVFQSHDTEPGALYLVGASGGAAPTMLLAGTPASLFPTDWARDGRTILYQTFDAATRWDIWALPLNGDRKPIPLVHTTFDERDARFSPDGSWIAYSSDESGRSQIYVQRFPAASGKVPISTSGGVQPVWTHDGSELFYIALDGRLMSVPIRFSGNEVEASAPVPLFMTHVGPLTASLVQQYYAVSQDGQRFLMSTIADDSTTSPITVILNWNGKT
jgi:Tol biopolymer transport system component